MAAFLYSACAALPARCRRARRAPPLTRAVGQGPTPPAAPPAAPCRQRRRAAAAGALVAALLALPLPGRAAAAVAPPHPPPAPARAAAGWWGGGGGAAGGRALAVAAEPAEGGGAPGARLAGVVQYRVEELLTWSLTGQTVALWVGFFAVVGAGGYAYQRTTGFGMEKAYWRSWCALSGAEPDFSEDPWRAKVVVSVLTVLQFLFFALLVGAVEGSMVRKLGELKGGRTQVYERGHEVILGWNSRLPRVLRQIAIASESNGDRVRIVVLADEDKEMMDARIKEYVTRGEFKHVTIINRSGDPTSRADQDLVAIGSAKKVLILSGTDDDDASDDGDGGAANGDSLAFKTALALKHSAAAAGVRTVVESRSARNDGMDACLGPNFTQLLWPDLASRHIVKAALQPSGLVDVHRELLDFDGHELYTRGFRELEGRSVEEASKMLRGGLLVGIARRTGEVLLNPVGREVVGRGDQVVLLAENKTRTSVTELSGTGAGGNGAVARVDVGSGGGRVTIAAPRRNVLVLGWRPGMSRILDEIDGTVGAGSRVSIVAAVPEARRRAVLERERYAPGRARNVRVLHTEADPCDVDSVARALGAAGRVDSVLVLMDHASPARNNRQRESRVLESLVALRMGLARRGRPAAAAAARAPNIVAEVMSLETERLARADNPGIEAVSLDEFSALLLAQAAYEPDMLSTLRTLLSRDGPEMALRPAWGLYRSGEDAVTFDALVRRGRERRETVLGYIANADGRLVLNPAKATVVPRAAVRHIVAIVEDIHAVVGP